MGCNSIVLINLYLIEKIPVACLLIIGFFLWRLQGRILRGNIWSRWKMHIALPFWRDNIKSYILWKLHHKQSAVVFKVNVFYLVYYFFLPTYKYDHGVQFHKAA